MIEPLRDAASITENADSDNKFGIISKESDHNEVRLSVDRSVSDPELNPRIKCHF